MKISDILEEAAQQHESGNSYYYSCWTIEDILETKYKGRTKGYYKKLNIIKFGLNNMGLDVECTCAFAGVPHSEQAQARSLWLTWAAMMAREQGL